MACCNKKKPVLVGTLILIVLALISSSINSSDAKIQQPAVVRP